MHAHTDRDQFAPPRPPARLRAIALAVLAHAILIAALTWGVNWKSSSDMPAVQAELWSAVFFQFTPQVSAPISTACTSTASVMARRRAGGRGGAN